MLSCSISQFHLVSLEYFFNHLGHKENPLNLTIWVRKLIKLGFILHQVIAWNILVFIQNVQ